ncbi:MAG: cyclodeaminase [Anaerolineae bacterium]
MKITILTESEIRQCVRVDEEALTAVADAFTRLANNQAVMPPIMRVDVPENNGEVDIKSAYLKGLDSFAVKMSSGFFNNRQLGLPSLSGMMILLSSVTGFPQALLLDNGYLTDVRTGIAGAIAAQHLAPKQVTNAGVIGAGAQGRYQMRSLQLVRSFERLFVYDLDSEQVDKYVTEMSAELGVEVVKAGSVEAVVRQSDIVVTTTPAKSPYLKAEWLHPGMHITAMGSDAEEKNELFPEVLGRADLLVCDRKSQVFRLGEHHHALEAGVISEADPIVELGEITGGMQNGRTADNQITFCDLTGTGAQDTAIALLAYRKAQEKELGMRIDA